MRRWSKSTGVHFEGRSVITYSIYPCTYGNMSVRCYRGSQRYLPGPFLQATMDEDVWIKFEGEWVDVLLEFDTERYGSYVCQYKERKFLYARAVKTIYDVLWTTEKVRLRTE